MTPEGKVKKKIKDLLKANRVWYFLPGNNGYGMNGIPDIIAIVEGKFVGIEVKAETGRLTELQKKRGDEIIQAGGLYVVVRGSNEIIKIEQILRELRC
jgi:hypothetical protein